MQISIGETFLTVNQFLVQVQINLQKSNCSLQVYINPALRLSPANAELVALLMQTCSAKFLLYSYSFLNLLQTFLNNSSPQVSGTGSKLPVQRWWSGLQRKKSPYNNARRAQKNCLLYILLFLLLCPKSNKCFFYFYST